MIDHETWKPLPDRPCGGCDVCCISLTIDEEDLQKLPGHRCKDLTKDRGCSIHPTRPNTCRTFECGWKTLQIVSPQLRPDISGVLIRGMKRRLEDGTTRDAINFAILRRSALEAEGFAETVAAAVNAGLAVYFSVPGPPGHTSSLGRIDQVLRHAVITEDRDGLRNLLRQAYARAKGRPGAFSPVKLKHLKRSPAPEPGAAPPS